MLLIILAIVLIAIAFGVGALIHFLWLGLVILVIAAIVGLLLRL